jgi:hypothetical protein
MEADKFCWLPVNNTQINKAFYVDDDVLVITRHFPRFAEKLATIFIDIFCILIGSRTPLRSQQPRANFHV